MKRAVVLLGLLIAATPLFAAEGIKPCEELKGEIAAKLDAKGVKGYELSIVRSEEVKDAAVVGSCGGGTMKIVYSRK